MMTDESNSDAANADRYLQPVEDGLPIQEFGPWVADKLHYVQRYIYMFATSMRKKRWRNVRYIDLFSGGGKCIIPESGQILLGSPLLALTTSHPFSDYVFVDKDPKNVEVLALRCKYADIKANVQVNTGDGNQLVHEIVDAINQADQKYIPGVPPSINLAFLDPYGLGVKWDTVAKLATVNRMDLIIHYSQQGLTRNFENCYHSDDDTAIDEFFGDRNWRGIYEKFRANMPTSAHPPLIDYYRQKLEALGYVSIHDVGPLMRNVQRNAPLYRLLFASKHPLGYEFWEKVTKTDSHGQQKLF